MLSYVYFGTNDLERAIAFYTATLGALGMRRCVTSDPAWDRGSAGWGMYEDDGLRELAFWSGSTTTARSPPPRAVTLLHADGMMRSPARRQRT